MWKGKNSNLFINVLFDSSSSSIFFFYPILLDVLRPLFFPLSLFHSLHHHSHMHHIHRANDHLFTNHYYFSHTLCSFFCRAMETRERQSSLLVTLSLSLSINGSFSFGYFGFGNFVVFTIVSFSFIFLFLLPFDQSSGIFYLHSVLFRRKKNFTVVDVVITTLSLRAFFLCIPIVK